MSLSTHDTIRTVATGLFAERGYSGASMGDIAARVGIRKASLYNYYGSKEELLLDLLERSLSAWQVGCRGHLGVPGPLRPRLRAHLEAALAFVRRHRSEVAIVRLAGSQIGGSLGARVQRLLAEQSVQVTTVVRREFELAFERGEMAEPDPDLAVQSWKVVLDGMVINSLYGYDVDASLGRVFDVLWRGLRGRCEDVGR